MTAVVWVPSSSDSDWDPSSWFPSPLSSNPDDSAWDGDQTVRRIHGRCAPFCQDDGPGRDETVSAHGPACESRDGFVVPRVVTRTDAGTGTVLGSLAAPYLHGIYKAWDAMTVEDHGYVQLSVDGGTEDSTLDLCLTAEQARAVAAGLYRLAADLEQVRPGTA